MKTPAIVFELPRALARGSSQLLVRTRPDLVRGWSNEEIARRWSRLAPAKDIATGEPVEPS